MLSLQELVIAQQHLMRSEKIEARSDTTKFVALKVITALLGTAVWQIAKPVHLDCSPLQNAGYSHMASCIAWIAI